MEEENKKGFVSMIGGCLLKIIGVLLLVFVIIYVKACNENAMKQRQKAAATYSMYSVKLSCKSEFV